MDASKQPFKPLERSVIGQERIVRPTLGYWQDAWRRLKKNKLAMAGLVILILLTIMSIIGPMMSPHTYDFQNYEKTNLRPNAEYWFGTDDFGRDLWTRVWMGTRISLFIGVMAALIDLVLGVLYGGISAYYGGRIDNVMQRFIEVVYSIPYLLIAILLVMVLEPGVWAIIFAYAITGWIGMARLVRGQLLSLKEQEFVLAGRTLGAGARRIILRHLIPNSLGVIIVSITFAVPSAIFAEAFLSFIGIGIKPPLASLGALLSDGAISMRLHPHRLLIPTAVFSLILLSFNLLGDGLRDALDPKMRK
ncbi:ABC transporter permease [Paenibacillus thermoaerophilus]|uniref:ABC transporter permease n=1 Tax=Paenibacillus thermoaerophilus TaxID=1215385 RepID=A0ABW2V1E7_9BACL|nr:ABC transporter permease [Paenibacillus thermoaerophilus]TMV19065.1 ABC transporter permease [Paenibacillus thermoaerophilus]